MILSLRHYNTDEVEGKQAAFVWGGGEKFAILLNDTCVHHLLFRDEPAVDTMDRRGGDACDMAVEAGSSSSCATALGAGLLVKHGMSLISATERCLKS